MPKYRIGLDLSIKSTGVCVRDTDTGECWYYIIAAKLTKKQKAFKHDRLEFIEYYWEKPDKNDDFQTREQKKTNNIWQITRNIKGIVFNYIDVRDLDSLDCVIEGISYGSSSSAALADLSGLNYAVRCMLKDNSVPFSLAAPMQLKKFAVGNGGADKAMMTDAWKRCQPEMADISEIKDDDIADAYFLSVWETE